MSGDVKIILIALGVLLALGTIVSLTLNHHIGGFLETVTREEEEQAALVENEKHEKTGV